MIKNWHRLVPKPGTNERDTFWYRVIARTGTKSRVLAPVETTTQYQKIVGGLSVPDICKFCAPLLSLHRSHFSTSHLSTLSFGVLGAGRRCGPRRPQPQGAAEGRCRRGEHGPPWLREPAAVAVGAQVCVGNGCSFFLTFFEIEMHVGFYGLYLFYEIV